MSIDDQIARLQALAASQNSDPAEFEALLESLSSMRVSDEQLGQLFGIFRDAYPFQEVLWSLLHLLESQGIGRYVKTYAESLESMRVVAAEWAETIGCRLLNADGPRQQLKRDLHLAGTDTIEAFKELMRPVAESSRGVGERARDFLEELGA